MSKSFMQLNMKNERRTGDGFFIYIKCEDCSHRGSLCLANCKKGHDICKGVCTDFCLSSEVRFTAIRNERYKSGKEFKVIKAKGVEK